MEHNYLCLLKDIFEHGEHHEDRTGVGTRSLFGRHLTFDVGDSYPLLTTKRLSLNSTFHELRWFLSGSTNVNDLHPSVQKWWKPWADEHGNLGPIYGEQLRNHWGIDQVALLLDQVVNNPNSRRIIATTWSPSEIHSMRLPPCHGLVIQLKVHEKTKRISLSMYQRSADMFLGVPYNIASYSLLLNMICWVTGYQPEKLVMTFGDCHIYENHIDQVRLQLSRVCRPFPHLVLKQLPEGDTPLEKLLNFDLQNFELRWYDPHPVIRAPLAI